VGGAPEASGKNRLDGGRLRGDELARRRRARRRRGTGAAPSRPPPGGPRLRTRTGASRAPATAPTFWVCPATLVFDEARDLAADINLPGPSFEPSLDAIRRSGPDEDGTFVWNLVGRLFSIGLRASGFTQYLRRAPVHSPRPRLAVEERGGLSFGQNGYAR
jgi:hypothetical protein